MLAGKVEDMLNTVVRQIAFYRFETLLHEERRKGELPAEQIAAIWMQVQRESLGPAFDFSEDYGVYWAYIPHFVHSPFYVYAYAFGDCLVNALYGVYRDGGRRLRAEIPRPAEGRRHAAAQGAAGALRARRLRPAFWQRGLDVIAGFIDELERTRDERHARWRTRQYDLRRDAAAVCETSGAVGGIAARVAGQRMFGLKTDKTRMRKT